MKKYVSFKEVIEKAEKERVRRFRKWLKEKANWEMSEVDAEIILDVTEAFLQAEREGEV
jgi:uncharacterized protein (DUF2164 family)